MRHDPARWRSRFPILASTNYLVSHSLGAMPAAVREKLAAFADQWASRGVRAWGEGWWSSPVDVGDQVAGLLNAAPGTVVMHPNVSTIQSVVASTLDFAGRRNKVVYTDLNFPTNMYVWESYRRLGARIEVVPTDGIEVDTDRLLEAIDEETLVVPISHVCYKSHFIQDADRIAARARDVGALVLLDTYQSLGTVPVDVRAWGVDMVCGGSVKWLCGGPGAGYLYVRPDLIDELEPRLTGWAAHADPFAFETGPQRYAHGVRRLLNGSPPVAAYLAATAGYAIVREVGIEAIRAYSRASTARLAESLADRGFRIHGPRDPERRGGTLTVALGPDESGPAFVKALEARSILVDHRPGAGLRVSPHFYTLTEELDEFAEALSEIRERERWREFVSSGTDY